MFIKLTPDQIPRLWDAIKFAVSQIDDISKKNQALYLNRLLHALLSGKAWCIVRMSEDRELLGIGILRIIDDDITGESAIFIECIYSFARTSIDIWKEVLDLTIKYAEREKCSKITAYSSNPRVFKIAKELGFDERYRYFEMEI
jgi:hypothetical protein